MNRKHWLTAILMLLSVNRAVMADSPDTVQNPTAQNADENGDIFGAHFRAAAETRYQSHMLNEYANDVSWWSRMSLVFSAVSFIASTIFANFKKIGMQVFLGLLGCVGLIASLRSDDSKAAARYIDHAVLEKRWENLRNEWDELSHRKDAMSVDQLKANVSALLSQQASLQSAEPTEVNDAAWDNAWVEEAQVENLSVPPKPKPAKEVSLSGGPALR